MRISKKLDKAALNTIIVIFQKPRIPGKYYLPSHIVIPKNIKKINGNLFLKGYIITNYEPYRITESDLAEAVKVSKIIVKQNLFKIASRSVTGSNEMLVNPEHLIFVQVDIWPDLKKSTIEKIFLFFG